MSNGKCIIVGASHAGTTLAMQLRKEGWQGPITLVGAEAELPYHRPPLSKEYLSGKKELDGMRLRPEQAFADNDIELRLGESVLAIDADAREISLLGGTSENFDKLALCTGSSVRKLPIGEDFDNVFYLRTAADAALLRGKIKAGQKAVVIGAGYIGLEAAAVMSQLGLQVVVLEREASALPRVAGSLVAEFVQALHEANGVRFQFNASVSAFEGDGSVNRVICADGTAIDADLVIAGIGIVPNTRLAEDAGLVISNGIRVDEFAQTSHADIVAAGDCTNHPSLLYRRDIRLESVQNANDQARVAAANLCGKKIAYDAVPWFWSDQFSTKLQSTGLLQGFDECVVRGEPSVSNESGFAVFYLKAGKVIAADCVARPKEFMAVKQLLKADIAVDTASLSDESIEPASWLK